MKEKGCLSFNVSLLVTLSVKRYIKKNFLKRRRCRVLYGNDF